VPKLDQNANKTLAEAPTLGNLHPDARAQAIARGSREDALIAALRTHDGDAPDGWQFGLGLVKFDDHGQFADFRWATQSDIDAAIERAAPQAQPSRQSLPRCIHCGRHPNDPKWDLTPVAPVQPERKPMTDDEMLEGREYAEAATLAAQAQAPAWHDKPTAPGVWVVGSRCLHINELDLPIYERSNCRWFGPVPADDGDKQ
jgi:hypothetical protein